MKVTNISRDKLSKVKVLFETEKNSFLLSQKIIDKKSRLKYKISEVVKSDEFFLAKENKEVLGYASFKKLNWDTKHFGIKMGSLEVKCLGRNYSRRKDVASSLIKRVLEETKEKRFSHLSIKINSSQIEEIHALEENGFYYMGCLVSYILDLNNFNDLNFSKITSVDIKEFKRQDLKQLKEIVFNSFRERSAWFDRFHADPYLDKKKSDELYVKWFVNCCHGKEANLVLVAKKDGRPVGFISAKYNKEIKRYLGRKVAGVPLNAVDKKFRGQGIYHALVHNLLPVLKRKGFDYAIITTQLTTKAVAGVWIGAGAKVESSKLVFHKMLSV